MTDIQLEIWRGKYVKGVVQRKVRWVGSGFNRWVVLQCGGAGYFLYILKGHHLGLCKKRFYCHLTPILSVMWERVGKVLQDVCEELYNVYRRSTGAKECASHRGMALEPFSAN